MKSFVLRIAVVVMSVFFCKFSGASGIMYRSSDFGQSWTDFSAPATSDLYGLAFGQNDSDVFVTGANGTFFQSSNAGQTWASITLATTNDLYDVASDRTNTHYFLVGENGTMFRAGSPLGPWTNISISTTANLYGVSFGETDRDIFVVGTEGAMYRSGDFGQTWTNISVPTTNDLYGVAFGKTESDIYVVGESGTVMQSSNFGQTWTNIDISTTSNLYDIASDRTNSHFFIVGEGGAMYRAGSFGGAWTDISLPTTTNFFGASFGETDRNVYVVGQTVPEPSTFSLLGIGAIGLIVWIWRWKRTNSLRTISLAAVMVFVANTTTADSFGIGENQFTIDFVPITYTSNPSSGYGIVNNAYRMGTYEITNEQWNKFILSYGTVTGSPITAYDQPPNFTGTNVPTNNVSWYEAAQFVNWLNTSTGHHEAYAFTGTQGTGDYSLTTWNATEADQGTNLLRHKDAFYFLPTVHEWAKAAYWNGTTLQNYATQDGDWPPQGNGTSGTGWNYWNNTTGQFATTPPGPWIVGSGSQELNGTYDMMGNVWEWMENPFFSPSSDPQYNSTDYPRGVRGGSYSTYWGTIISSDLGTDGTPTNEFNGLGFRVASIPEPASIILFGAGILGGFTCYWRRKHFYR